MKNQYLSDIINNQSVHNNIIPNDTNISNSIEDYNIKQLYKEEILEFPTYKDSVLDDMINDDEYPDNILTDYNPMKDSKSSTQIISLPNMYEDTVAPNKKVKLTWQEECTITNYPFLYEFGLPKRMFNNTQSSRWKYCSKIYIVFQGPNQIGVAKHLDTPHYQMSIKEINKILVDNNNSINCDLIFVGIQGNINDENMYIQTKALDNIIFPVSQTVSAIKDLSDPLDVNKKPSKKIQDKGNMLIWDIVAPIILGEKVDVI